MKTLFTLSFVFCTFFYSNAQTIPFGQSEDSIITSDNRQHNIHYYKPNTYDSINSPLLLAIHGIGECGSCQIGTYQAIADRRKALIVAPVFKYALGYSYGVSSGIWLPIIFKEIYRYILSRENRDTIPVYLAGWSAGGQCVTRYMLIRQAIPDSMPIRMAVSGNPFYYTFCTDSLNGNFMPWPCGLGLPGIMFSPDFICDEHISMYYNENYGVLIGTADTMPNSWQCATFQGNNRYQRAKNFYAFSDTDAIARGTTLKWQYAEVPGVDHNGNLMWSTKADTADTSTIAETLLFDSPYNPVPQFAPVAAFTADTAVVSLPNANVQFFNESILAMNYLWDFGDITTSTDINPLHQYTYADTFTVTLTAINGTGCESIAKKWDYIIVKNPVGLDEFDVERLSISIYPSPFSTSATIRINPILLKDAKDISFALYDLVGREVKKLQVTSEKFKVERGNLPGGLYFYSLRNNEGIIKTGKIVIQ